MKILSHRGYWKTEAEKNKEQAFTRSFSMNFGTETDVRDFNGELVISHDIPTGSEMKFEDFIRIANENDSTEKMTLALNVKSDGLAKHIGRIIRRFENLDCFVFDMSVPDMRSYLRENIPVFSRISEVEQQPVWLSESEGIWLDSFESDWFSNSLITELLNQNKRVCIVSPELHKRDNTILWDRIKPLADQQLLMLCTDYPEQAQEFFEIQT
jgi:hypothetical protein